MSEELKAKHKQAYYAAFNEGNVDALDEVIAPDYVYYRPPFADIAGREAFKVFVRDVRASYPDAKLTFQKQVIEGDSAATLWTFEGTQTGVSPSTGAAPSNKYIKYQGCSMTRMESGRTVEEWALHNYLGLMQQLGVVPEFT